MIVFVPARGSCVGTSGTLTSSNSSCATARIVKASGNNFSRIPYVTEEFYYSQTPMQNPKAASPVMAFLTRYGLRARIRAADCL